MEIAEHIDALDSDGVLLAEAAHDAGLTAQVPACPGWQVRDLVRHQAYETAIHRYDAQAARAAGEPSPQAAFAPAFAADGIDELMGFAGRRRSRSPGDGTRSLAIRAADVAGRWHVRFAGGAVEVSRDDAAADCMLDGPASGLYALLWNRCRAAEAGVAVTGDPDLLRAWSSTVRIRWR